MQMKRIRLAAMSVLTMMLVAAGLSRRSWEQGSKFDPFCLHSICMGPSGVLPGEPHPSSTLPAPDPYDLRSNANTQIVIWRSSRELNVRDQSLSIVGYEMTPVGLRQQAVASATPKLQPANAALLSYPATDGRFKRQRIEFDLADKPQQFTLKFNPTEKGTHFYVVVAYGKNARNEEVQAARLFTVEK